MKVISGRIFCSRIFRSLCLAALTLSLAAPAIGSDKRDALWEIVSTCLDPGAADYCTVCISPREEAGCNRPCRNSTQVWDESKNCHMQNKLKSGESP
jgi:hypothetical protein